jgi:hypothetical protein
LAAVHEDHLVLRPVWDWGEMLNDKDIALFSNPLYKRPQLTEAEIEKNRRSRLPPTALKLPGFDDLPKNHPKLRYSLQPVKTSSIDFETNLRPSQLSHHTTTEAPKKKSVEKASISGDDQVRNVRSAKIINPTISFLSDQVNQAESLCMGLGHFLAMLLSLHAASGGQKRRQCSNRLVQPHAPQPHAQDAKGYRDGKL